MPFFMQEWLQAGEKCGFIYAQAEYYLQPNTVGRHCPWASHGGLSAIKEQEIFLNFFSNVDG